MRRHNLTFRRVTTLGRDLPKNARDLALEFIQTAQAVTSRVDLSEIYAMDETGIEVDSPSEQTYEQAGVSRVRATTAGQERSKVHVLFCAAADGTKLPPLILIPRKKHIPLYTPPDNVVLVYKT